MRPGGWIDGRGGGGFEEEEGREEGSKVGGHRERQSMVQRQCIRMMYVGE